MSIARVTMHELKEEGTHHKLEEIYAKIVDEYFPNLEQVINIKTGPKSGISIALYPSFEEAEKKSCWSRKNGGADGALCRG